MARAPISMQIVINRLLRSLITNKGPPLVERRAPPTKGRYFLPDRPGRHKRAALTALDIFPQKAHDTESHFAIRGISCENSEHPSRPLNPRKSDSYAAPTADLREREYLTPKEVDRLQDAARKHSRYGHRDATAILLAYRHGLRASELCELTWNMIEHDSGRIHVRRAKNGVDSTHPLTGKEIRALRQLRRENLQSRYVFNTERGGPVTRATSIGSWFVLAYSPRELLRFKL